MKGLPLPNAGAGAELVELPRCWWACKMTPSHRRAASPITLNTHLLSNPVSLYLGTHWGEVTVHREQTVCTRMFRAASPVIPMSVNTKRINRGFVRKADKQTPGSGTLLSITKKQTIDTFCIDTQ